jgi:hypothetical protein
MATAPENSVLLLTHLQLYLNYKLKSVAHLPWRQMTYKFLNTIIDDLFAFVIKMPLLHRLSVFRSVNQLLHSSLSQTTEHELQVKFEQRILHGTRQPHHHLSGVRLAER